MGEHVPQPASRASALGALAVLVFAMTFPTVMTWTYARATAARTPGGAAIPCSRRSTRPAKAPTIQRRQLVRRADARNPVRLAAGRDAGRRLDRRRRGSRRR